MPYEIEHDEAEWRAKLNPIEYAVLREAATERPWTGELLDEHRAGLFTCRACGNELFLAGTKFDSGCGWPSFYEALDPAAVEERVDTTHGMRRVEVVCRRCGGHLGHVFPDGPRPTGLRYCINSASLAFTPAEPETK